MKIKNRSKEKANSQKVSMVKESAASYKPIPATPGNLPYKSFEVINFRCFDKLKIGSLNRINLFTGINNSGKTSFLEALFIHLGPKNPALIHIINSYRGLNIVSDTSDNQWAPVFWKFKDSNIISLTGTDSKGKQRTLEIHTGFSKTLLRGEGLQFDKPELISGPGQEIVFEYIDESGKKTTVKGTPVFVKKDNMMMYELRVEPSLLPSAGMRGIFISGHVGSDLNEEIKRFSNLRKKEKDSIILSALKIIEPRLEQLEILTFQGVNMLHGHLNGFDEPVPSPIMGGGVQRALSMLLAIGSAENGVVLVDEIENGIHHSALKDLWAVIAESSKTFNCQVFATTHSDECIRAAHEAFKEIKSYDLMLYRLDRKNGSIQSVMYDEETLDAALSIPLEVRG